MDRHTKRARGSAVVEACVTGAARDVARATGLFRVPAVLDVAGDSLVLEDLGPLVPLAALMDAADPGLHDTMVAAGRALGAIHRDMELPDDCTGTMPPPWDAPDAVCLHGDYTAHNVLIDASGDLVVLDWAAAPMLRTVATRGSSYFDVVWFLAHLRRAASAKRLLLPFGRWSDAFLVGYRQERPGAATASGVTRGRSLLRGMYRADVSAAAALRPPARGLAFRAVQAVRALEWSAYRPPAGDAEPAGVEGG